MASTEDPYTAPTDGSAPDEPEQTEPQRDDTPEAATDAVARVPRKAAKKAPRKRAARKAVEPSLAADDSSDLGPNPAELPHDGSDRPAKQAARTRGSRTASAPLAAPEPAEPPLAWEDAVSAEDLPEHVPERQRADAEAAEAAEAADDADDAPAPSFGVLFQAPAATVTTGRASAQAAAPSRDGAADDTGEEDPGPRDTSDPAGAGAGDRVAASEDGETAETARDDDDSAAADSKDGPRRRRRRGGKGRRGRATDTDSADEDGEAAQPPSDGGVREPDLEADQADDTDGPDESEGEGGTRRRTRRRRRSGASGDSDEAPGVVTRVREPRRERDEVTGLRGSTRLEAKKQRRREGREAGRRRTVITEAEFLARRESVDRVMVVRTKDDRTQIGVLEDGVLVEHYISRETSVSMAGNIYLGRVQNVLPSMEAAFVDIGKGRNAVLYAGEVNWDAAGMEANQPRRIEHALSSGESVLVQVTKDPIAHKGARLTSQISLPGRYLVYVPNSSMTGISRKLPDTERTRLKNILKEVVPESAGVIVRTAAEGASEEELRADVERLTRTWEEIRAKAETSSTGKGKGKGKGGGSAPLLLHGEPDLTVRVIRDVFNEDFASLVVAGQEAWDEVSDYVNTVAPDLAERVSRWTSEEDLFTHYRVDEQIAKAMDRKVWLPSGGSLVIDRTEAMTVVDVNTGKFIGSGGNLEETVTKNNIEAAEEVVRQLRLRDIGGIIVVDFIDMVLESNRELVVRRLLECLGRDRTKHQVAEVTSLGLVQMTRKRVGSGLIEVFGEVCEHCNGRGIIVHADPVDRGADGAGEQGGPNSSSGGPGTGRGGLRARRGRATSEPVAPARSSGPTPAQIAAAAHAAAIKSGEHPSPPGAPEPVADLVVPPEHGGLGDQQERTEPEELLVGASTSDEHADSDLVSEILGAEGGGLPEPAADEPADPVQGPGQPRRRRGRIVAPAGPPRVSSQPLAGP